MIGKLKGRRRQRRRGRVDLDVDGVGYVVAAPRARCAACRARERRRRSHIETQVREDRDPPVRLPQRRRARLVPPAAERAGRRRQGRAGILGAPAGERLAAPSRAQDKATIARAPGVGPKLAARIVAELKDKAPAFGTVDAMAMRLAGEEAGGEPGAVRDAISALCNLGYGRPQAATAVAASVKALGEDADASALIRRGLKELAR